MCACPFCSFNQATSRVQSSSLCSLSLVTASVHGVVLFRESKGACRASMQAIVSTHASADEGPGSQLECRVESLDQRITGVPRIQVARHSQNVWDTSQPTLAQAESRLPYLMCDCAWLHTACLRAFARSPRCLWLFVGVFCCTLSIACMRTTCKKCVYIYIYIHIWGIAPSNLDMDLAHPGDAYLGAVWRGWHVLAFE